MLTRRGFLKAGLATAAAAAVPFDGGVPTALLDALAAGPRCGRLQDIEHVVIVIQENRSFDHYLGRLRGVRGFDDRSVRQPDGTSVFAQRFDGAGTRRVLPFHIDTAIQPGRPGMCTNDIDHQWLTQHASWNGGAMDRWVVAHVASNGPADGPLTMGFYDRPDIQLYYALADLFTVCDGYHCSVIGGTDINRLYSIAGTMDPDGFDGGAQFIDTRGSDRQQWFGRLGAAGRWVTYPEQLQAHGVSWKVYAASDAQQENNVLQYFKAYQDPASPLFLRGVAGSQSEGPVPADFVADCAAGTLPQVSWLLASLTDSEHPPAPIEWGEDFTYRVLRAVTSNPSLWARTAIFLTYDENGGFFDHVPPAVPAAGTAGEFLTGLHAGTPAWTETGGGSVRGPIGLGFRVPMLVVSPFSRGGLVSSARFDHTSLLRFLETRFGAEIPAYDAARRRPGLTPWRRQAVSDLTAAFNLAARPDTSIPVIPALDVPNRIDPRVLAECTTTGSPGNFIDSSFGTPYPVPATQSMPSQEPGRARRPSGLKGCPPASR